MFKIIHPSQLRPPRSAAATAPMRDCRAQTAIISSTVRTIMLRLGFETLVVEHRDEVFARIASDLRQMGARVTRAVSAAEAASLLATFSPDLVIANCELPDESGWLMVAKWQLTRRPRRVWMYASCPTGYDATWLGFTKVERIVYYRGDLWQLAELIGTHLEESLH